MLKAAAILLVSLMSVPASGDVFFTFSGGYSNAQMTGNNAKVSASTPFHFPRDGEYLDADLAAPVTAAPFPLLVGGGFSWTQHTDSVEATRIPGIFPEAHSQLNQYSLEARAAAPLYFSGSQGFFVEPRVGAGVLSYHFNGHNVFIQTEAPFFEACHFEGYAFEVRPALEVGYTWQRLSFGLDGSCMFAWGHFRPFGSTECELRAGAFLRYRF
jgi:hypothetical protein